MARNEEKNLSELNRFYLQKLKEKEEETKEKRPHLNTLKSASEIKKWIPSIKSEILFCLRHLSGIRNYPEYKIKEFQERLEYLKREYRRWVKKCLELDPNTIGIPGEPHAYISEKKNFDKKRKEFNSLHNDNEEKLNYKENFDDNHFRIEPSIKQIKIETPLLEKEKEGKHYNYQDHDLFQNQLLYVNSSKNLTKIEKMDGLSLLSNYESNSDSENNNKSNSDNDQNV
jgi:hypothetical protein